MRVSVSISAMLGLGLGLGPPAGSNPARADNWKDAYEDLAEAREDRLEDLADAREDYLEALRDDYQDRREAWADDRRDQRRGRSFGAGAHFGAEPYWTYPIEFYIFGGHPSRYYYTFPDRYYTRPYRYRTPRHWYHYPSDPNIWRYDIYGYQRPFQGRYRSGYDWRHDRYRDRYDRYDWRWRYRR